MILAIVGSRTFNGSIEIHVTDFIVKYGMKPVLIVSGGAVGVDALAEKYAKKHNIPFKAFLPDWKGKGKSAGVQRNLDIVKACTHMIAFPDSEGGKGTRDSIKKAKKLGKILEIKEY